MWFAAVDSLSATVLRLRTAPPPDAAANGRCELRDSCIMLPVVLEPGHDFPLDLPAGLQPAPC